MRIIARFEKGEAVRFVSHLDIQRTFQRAFRRANIPLAYSQGFNPHPQLSFATALALGYTSEAEWFDVKLAEEMDAARFCEAVNAVLPSGFRILEAQAAEDKLPALTALMAASYHEIEFVVPETVSANSFIAAFDAMASGEIFVEKRTKGGLKTVDIRPLLLNYRFSQTADSLKLFVFGISDAKGSLNIDLLLGALSDKIQTDFSYRVHKKTIFSHDGSVMPKMPVFA